MNTPSPFMQNLSSLVTRAVQNSHLGQPLAEQIADVISAAGYKLVPWAPSEKWRKTEDMSNSLVNTEIPVAFKTILGGTPLAYPTDQARQICEEILPDVIDRFLKKNKDYQENAQTLGYQGQFADIHRKYTKLKRAWWEGQKLESEPATEVAEDMIAHLLLGLLFARQEQEGRHAKGENV